jgi:hypothetical protein
LAFSSYQSVSSSIFSLLMSVVSCDGLIHIHSP